MNLGNINLITPPDMLFNNNLGYLLIKPSTELKIQFQSLLSIIQEDVNVHIYDNDENDILWLLNAANNVDVILIDIDNCDLITKNFISVLLVNSKCFYLTNDESIPWNLISRNRIYNLDGLIESAKKSVENLDDDDEEEEENEGK